MTGRLIHPCAPVWRDRNAKAHEIAVEWQCRACEFRSGDPLEVREHIWGAA